MVKPFALGELLARVRALLRRPVAEVPVLKAGKLELDPATRRVTYKGSLVFLSATEFSLLQYLLRNRGRVLSKSQILDHVWDDQGYRSANTVEVYVNYLRSKISPRLIKTVRGVGYVIGEEDEA
jgi:DNA-binding response OmpR family regulator